MAASKTAKGARHERRTIEWLVSQGFDAVPFKRTHRLYVKDDAARDGKRLVTAQSDIWGCDIIAKSAEEQVYVQVKANAGDVSKGVREMLANGPWPPRTNLMVVHWPHRRLTKVGPDIEYPLEIENG